MKKGFLLPSGKKAPRAKNGSVAGSKLLSDRPTMKNCTAKTSTSTNRSNAHPSPSQTTTSPKKTGKSKISPDDSIGGMKRGFLLADSSRDNKLPPPVEDVAHASIHISNNNNSQNLPQCRPGNGRLGTFKSEQAVQPKKRITTTSTALLDFEESVNNLHDDDYGHNEQEPVVSLLRLVEDESDDGFGKRSSDDSDHDSVPGDARNDNPSLDSWIQPSSSSSQPSIFIPSTTAPSTSQRKSSVAKKPGQPFIVEVEKPTAAQKVICISSHSTKQTTKSPDPSLDHDIETERIEPMNSRKISATTDPSSKLSIETDAVNYFPSHQDTLRFTNAVSLLLAQLRHSAKSPKRSTNIGTSNKDLVVGVDTFINNQSSALIKAFTTNHLNDESKVVPLGCMLWKMILEPIAQNYTESIQSRKKKKKISSKTSISPQLAVGLGVFGSPQPTGLAYASLADVLSEATHVNSIGRDKLFQESQSKQQKILVLGAIYLVRCRIRCIGITMTNMEVRPSGEPLHDTDEGMRQGLQHIESELGILLSKVLPALGSIASNDAIDCRTILTTAATDACFELIEVSSRAVVLQHMLQLSAAPGTTNANKINQLTTKSIQVWRDIILPLIEKLLAVKHRWVSRSNKSSQTDINTENARSGPSRAKCTMSVLDDWSDVLKASKRSFFDHFVGDDCHDNRGADFTSGLNLFWNLAGIPLRRTENADSTENSCFRVGGIAQSLCQSQECTFGASIDSESHDYGGSVEAEDLVSLVEEAAKLTDSIRNARKMGKYSEAWTKENHQRAAIRALASWLSRGHKAVRTLTKNKKRTDAVDLLDSAMASLVVLLRSESKQCVDASIATLSMLLSAAPELLSDQTAHPNLFLDLLDALHMHSSQYSFDEKSLTQPDQSAVDPTSRGLCVIVARVASQRPAHLMPFILKMKGRVEIMIEVMLNMLEQLPNEKSPPSKYDIKSGNPPNNVVYHAASKMLLENIESVPYLRSRMRTNQLLFSNVPCEIIIPQILEYLVRQYAERKSLASVSSLSGLLCNIMKANTNSGRVDYFVRCVVKSLQIIEEKEPSQKSSVAKEKTQVATFLNKTGPLWRLALLEESTLPDCAYKDVLLAAAKSLIEMPSSGTPLALLASLVDSQFHTMDQTEKRIVVAASGIIHFAMSQISLVDEQTIFRRLAPLLILRRIPRSYYRAVHKNLLAEKDTMHDLLNFLSKSIKSHALKNDQGNLAKEEKKLVAELAGHCLPFSNKSSHAKCSSLDEDELPVSLFQNICRDPFSDTLIALRGDPDALQLDNLHGIFEAKAALYATSHSVPLDLDEDDGEALLNVASFVFEVLQYQPELVSGMAMERVELFRREIMMLQSGCSHFLAVCMDSISCRMTKGTEQSKQSPLIEDLGCPGASKKTEINGYSFLEALSKIFHTLKSIMTTGEIGWETLYHEVYAFSRPVTKERHTAIRFSPSSRTQMLNSMVMLSQGSRAEDSRLDWLAYNTLPTLVEWTSKGPMDDGIHHPFCIAAALQVIYTLLARCASFGWLSRYPNSSNQSEADFVCRILHCALKSFNSNKGDGPAISVLRLAALKVILTVVALNQAGEMESEKGLEVLQAAMSALQGAANLDQNPEVRRLANHIIPYLQTS